VPKQALQFGETLNETCEKKKKKRERENKNSKNRIKSLITAAIVFLFSLLFFFSKIEKK
jgi:cell division protein FtsB